MIAEAIAALMIAWAAWAAACAGVFLLGALSPKPRSWAHFDGFRVVVPESLLDILTPEEFAAVRQHEEGHRRRMHPWLNLVGACLLVPATREVLMGQELEADDSARDPLAMARAIRKLGGTQFDIERAERLERAARHGMPGGPATHPREAGNTEGRL